MSMRYHTDETKSTITEEDHHSIGTSQCNGFSVQGGGAECLPSKLLFGNKIKNPSMKRRKLQRFLVHLFFFKNIKTCVRLSNGQMSRVKCRSHKKTCVQVISQIMVFPFSRPKGSYSVQHLRGEKLKGAVMQHCGAWSLLTS